VGQFTPDPMENGANRAFVAEFRRHWEEWEKRQRPLISPFLTRRPALIGEYLFQLYHVLGWITDEIEMRKKERQRPLNQEDR
jgi:hypothetical protein